MDLADHSASVTPLGAGLTAALDWWRGAGVDCDFLDDPRDWLPAPSVQEPAQDVTAKSAARAETRFETGSTTAAQDLPRALRSAAPLPPVGGTPDGWPRDFEAFSAWWHSEPSLDHGIVMDRIAPRGPQGAALMVLVEHPEPDDREYLLSGPQGQLLDAFLQAAGLDPASVYRASALPRHTPMPDWNALIAAGLGAIAAHHVRLAAPQRVICLGSNISSLLGHDPTNSAETLRGINHDDRIIPVLVAPGLEEMLKQPRRKAVLWQRWLDWTDEIRP